MSTFLRQATNAARQSSLARSFSSSVSRKVTNSLTNKRTDSLFIIPNIPADIIRDVYLREIKAYKPAPVAKDAHVGVVKSYSLPPVPKVPAVPTDLASELSAYDASEPTVAPATAATEASDEGAGGAAEYLIFLEQDVPKPAAHH
ncbi:hypothetical protein AMATHDRAFT_47936 [Amanita thiersii Skay4041]|uniref:Uncharacterized protein n=1 Tax=Amanita thiersii Skay4041 TaxID=703135 RepID=A0A2A9NRN6_9AGAR|nr:hypothetical protein AMATHDRAFT_47936 [Amanita thiersii Skay4041]